MNRRRFLSISTASLAVPLLPRSLAGFGEDGPVDAELLGTALKRSRAAGRPLLCLVVPADSDERWTRAKVLGAWLNHMDDAALLDLALTDLVCASTQAIETHGFQIGKDPLPWMLLYPADGAPPKSVQGTLPAEPPAPLRDGKKQAALRDATAKERVSRLSMWLNEALFSQTDLKAHVATASAHLDADDRARIEAWLALAQGVAPDGALLRRGAALIRQRAADLPDQERAKVERALIDQVIQTERRARPAGAKWATANGCSPLIEGEETPYSIGCGLGYTPPLSRRFLYFYLHEPKDPNARWDEKKG